MDLKDYHIIREVGIKLKGGSSLKGTLKVKFMFELASNTTTTSNINKTRI